MLKIYYLSSEINPFSGITSLGLFSKEFPTILNENKDVDIRLTQPKYGYISDRRYILREVIRLKDLVIRIKKRDHLINLKSGFIPNSRVQVYFMEYDKYFKSTGELLYKSRNGRVYNNNNERFSFFVKGAIETLKKLYWIPDVIICNDWQTSILPQIFKEKYSNEFKKTKIVFIIHEINKLYNFENSIYDNLELSYNKKSKVQNNLLEGIKLSDAIYILNNKETSVVKKNNDLKKALKGKSYKEIYYSSSMNPSERIQIYNDILKDLKKK